MNCIGLIFIILYSLIFFYNAIIGLLYFNRNEAIIKNKRKYIEKAYFITNEDAYFKTLGKYKLIVALYWLLGGGLAFYMDMKKLRTSGILLIIFIVILYAIKGIFDKKLNASLKPHTKI